MKLYVKMIISYIVYAVAAFLIIATVSSSLTNKYLIKTRTQTLYDEAMLIANTYSNEPQINALATYLNAEIWVVDKDGLIQVDSTGERTGYIIQNFDPTATGNKSYMTGNFYGTFPYDVLSVSAPIVSNYRTCGYVLIHLPMENVNESQYQILNIIYVTGGIIFALSLIIMIAFHIFAAVPLGRIAKGAKQYADSNYNFKINVASHDEFRYIADTMNLMADEIANAEEYQHKFVANISHDFRSPLTSIKGFLEAILDGTIPPENQRKYLERVIGETERLTKLTQGMLTINTLDSAGHLTRANFDINKVIRTTAQSFEGQCLEKGIGFDITFDNDIVMVYADLGKIQQVLYNLIDNAIKFSGKDSTIYLSSRQRHDKVFVSVKDKGIGIPKNDVKKIFDRFYKSDASRGKDKKGTGLGLAIVKEIINSHGENIDVISTEGVGTEFIFSLPVSEEFTEE